MHRLLAAALVAALLLGASSAGLTLTYEQKTQPIGGLDYCYHEDWVHDRTWKGSLGAGQSFSVDLRFCDRLLDGRQPGTGGFAMRDAFRGGPLRLTAISTAGTVYEAYYRDRIGGRDLYWRCILRPLDLYHPGLLTSGVWTVTLTNIGRAARDVTLEVDVHGAGSVSWIHGNCPVQDWTV